MLIATVSWVKLSKDAEEKVLHWLSFTRWWYPIVSDSGVVSPETLVICVIPVSALLGRRGRGCLTLGCVCWCGEGCAAHWQKFQPDTAMNTDSLRTASEGGKLLDVGSCPFGFSTDYQRQHWCSAFLLRTHQAATFSSLCPHDSHFHSIPL